MHINIKFYLLLQTQVVENYKILLFMISTKNLPEDYEPPPSYNMLVCYLLTLLLMLCFFLHLYLDVRYFDTLSKSITVLDEL